MGVSAFGTGYVGLVSSICLVEVDNDVTCTEWQQIRVPNLFEMATQVPGNRLRLSKLWWKFPRFLKNDA